MDTRSSTPDSGILEVSSSDTKTDTYQQASEAKNFLLNVMSSNGELHHFDKIWELICKCTDENPVVFLDWVNLPAYANNANNVNNFNIVRAALGPANLQFYTPEILKNCLLDRLLMQGVVRVDDTSCLQCKDGGSLANLMKRMIEIACSNWMQALTGATRTDSSLEVLYARQKLVLNAKAYDLQAIDMVYIKYKDLEGLKRQSIEGASMGFTGKQVIHPDQVPIVQDAFLPSEAKIKWASGLITAFHEHQKSGKGAFTYEGSMIDMPTMRQAENIVDLVNAVMMHSSA